MFQLGNLISFINYNFQSIKLEMVERADQIIFFIYTILIKLDYCDLEELI